MNVKIIKFYTSVGSPQTKYTITDAVVHSPAQLIAPEPNVVICPSEWFNSEWISKYLSVRPDQVYMNSHLINRSPSSAETALSAIQGFASDKSRIDGHEYNAALRLKNSDTPRVPNGVYDVVGVTREATPAEIDLD